MVQVAKRGASVLKRRKSRNRMDGGPSGSGGAASSSHMASGNSGDGGQGPPPRSESDGDVVFYSEEPRSGACPVLPKRIHPSNNLQREMISQIN